MAVILQSQKEVDLSSGLKVDAEVVDGKLQLKVIGQILNISDESIVPVMTSNTTPSPFVASASSIFNSYYDAWKAFNGSVASNTDRWASSGNVPQWLKIDLGQQKIIKKYAITIINGDNQSPKSWTIEGSNDDSNWNVIHSVSNEPSWGAGERREYFTDQYDFYRFYRILISQNFGGSICTIGEFELFEEVFVDQYSPYGFSEYGPIDLGPHFREITSISTIKEIPQGTDVKIYTSTSNDYINYSEWSLVDENGNITSPQGRYVKIKIELIGNTIEREQVIYTFDQSDESKFYLNEYVTLDGALKLKTTYDYLLEKISDNDGYVLKHSISRNNFKNIENINIY